jgi:hypothetical protein
MTQVLGYRRFAAHGHDWGAFISTRLGFAHAADLVGIHITLLTIPRETPPGPQTADQELYRRQLAHWLKEETGYSAIMGTRPQTLAYALSDSPVGLASWIVEKFRGWSDCNGDGHFSRDVLLTNIMLYWLTRTINSSFWPYYARGHGPWIVPVGEKVMVPTGYAEHPREILTPPRALAEQTYGNIQRWTQMPRGGTSPRSKPRQRWQRRSVPFSGRCGRRSRPDQTQTSQASSAAAILLFLLSERRLPGRRMRRWPGVGRLVRIFLFLLETGLPAKSGPAFALWLAVWLGSSLVTRAIVLTRAALGGAGFAPRRVGSFLRRSLTLRRLGQRFDADVIFLVGTPDHGGERCRGLFGDFELG